MARKKTGKMFANDDRKAMSVTPGTRKKPGRGKMRKSSR